MSSLCKDYWNTWLWQVTLSKTITISFRLAADQPCCNPYNDNEKEIDEAADDNEKIIERNNEQRDKPGYEIVDEPDNETADDETNVEQRDKPGDEIVDEADNEAANDETNVEQETQSFVNKK